MLDAVGGILDVFMGPSLPDQAAFHEGFADVVALLSVFSLREAKSNHQYMRSIGNLPR